MLLRIKGPFEFGRRMTSFGHIYNVIRQHRKAPWHNGCPSHNLLRRLTLTHDLDNKSGEGMQE